MLLSLLADSGPFWQSVGAAIPGIVIVVLVVRHLRKNRGGKSGNVKK